MVRSPRPSTPRPGTPRPTPSALAGSTPPAQRVRPVDWSARPAAGPQEGADGGDVAAAADPSSSPSAPLPRRRARTVELPRPEPAPAPTPSERFALGGVRFLGGVERALQLRYAVGLSGGLAEMSGLPVLRLPLPENPSPAPFEPEVAPPRRSAAPAPAPAAPRPARTRPSRHPPAARRQFPAARGCPAPRAPGR